MGFVATTEAFVVSSSGERESHFVFFCGVGVIGNSIQLVVGSLHFQRTEKPGGDIGLRPLP